MLSLSYDLKRHLENLAASRSADQSPRRFRFMPIYGKSCESTRWEKPGGRVHPAGWGGVSQIGTRYPCVKIPTKLIYDMRERSRKMLVFLQDSRSRAWEFFPSKKDEINVWKIFRKMPGMPTIPSRGRAHVT